MQLRQDLVGCIGNLQRIAVRHRTDLQDVCQYWNDARAKHFIESDLPPVEEGVKRLITYLQKTLELTETIAQQTRDDRPEDQ